MRLWRGRRAVPQASPPAIRVERALVVMAVHAQRLQDRLDRLERRLEDVEDTATAALAPDRVDDLVMRLEDLELTAATSEDVLDLRLHGARVAIDVSRLATEVRAEVAAIRAATPSGQPAHRLEALAESILDLSDRIDTQPADLLGSDRPDDDWAATA